MAIFNVAGTQVGYIDKTSLKLSIKPNISRANFFPGPATASTTTVSSGQGLVITAQINNLIILFLGVRLQNNTASTTTSIQIYTNTTGVPSAGTSVGSDTPIPPGGTISTPTASTLVNGSLVGLTASPTLGVATFYYLAWSVSAGTTSMANFDGDLIAWEAA